MVVFKTNVWERVNLNRCFSSEAISPKCESRLYLPGIFSFYLIYKYFKNRIFHKLPDIRILIFPYIYCNFCRVCLHPPTSPRKNKYKRKVMIFFFGWKI